MNKINYQNKKFLNKQLFFFSVLLLPTIFLTSYYIGTNNNILSDSRNSVKLDFRKNGIYIIIFYMLLSNLICVFLFQKFKEKINSKHIKNFFLFPIFHSILILIILIFGKYSFKNCDQLDSERYCGCIFLKSQETAHQDAYKQLLNDKCLKRSSKYFSKSNHNPV